MSEAEPLYVPFRAAMARFPAMPISRHGWNAERFSGDDRLRLAIAVASSSLAEALERRPLNQRKASQALEKVLLYGIRACSRCTPFGLFASAAIIEWGSATDLEIGSERSSRTRIDMALLLTLVSALEAIPAVRRKLKVAAHPAARIRSGRLVLAGIDTPASPYGDANVSLRATAAVRHAIEGAQKPVRWTSLRKHIRECIPGASAEQVEGLMESLWRHGFLITSLRPPLVNHDPAAYVATQIANIPEAQGARSRLSEFLDTAKDFDTGRSGSKPAAISVLADRANALIDAQSNAPLQVDTAVTLKDTTVHKAVGEEVAHLAELLIRMSPYPSGPPVAATYYRAFVERHGVDGCIPLLDVVDVETGLSIRGHGQDFAGSGLAARGERLVRLAYDCALRGEASVELTEALLSELQTWSPEHGTAPRSLDVYALVAARSREAIDQGAFKVILGPNVGSNSAGRNLGRFSDMLPRADEILCELARDEQPDGAILAELLYPPERPRSCNVVLRKAVRERSLGVITSTRELGSQSIALRDLFVCARNGRLVVVTPNGKGGLLEIVAVAGHMLNHVRAPLVCRFLADIARARQPLLCGFDWGSAAQLPRLPRVQSGRAILFPARWRIDVSLRDADLHDPKRDFARFQEGWQVPRFVHYRSEVDAPDHQILLDLERDDHLTLLAKDLKKLRGSHAILLQEALPDPQDAWVTGPDGVYATELVVSLLRTAPPQETPKPIPDIRVRAGFRTRPPGSDWLYFKVYLYPAAEDTFISEELLEFAESLMDRAHAKAWTYIRYSDPDPHIRLRFHGAAQQLQNEVLPAAIDWLRVLVKSALVERFQIDTYERELERYGGNSGMKISEQIFAADSQCCAELLAYLTHGDPKFDKVDLGIIGLHDLVTSFAVDPLAWALAYRGGKLSQTNEFRARKAELIRLLGSPNERLGTRLETTLRRRHDRIASAAEQLRHLADRGTLGRPVERVLDSQAHLFLNRLLGRDRTREHQLIDMYLHCANSLRYMSRDPNSPSERQSASSPVHDLDASEPEPSRRGRISRIEIDEDQYRGRVQ